MQCLVCLVKGVGVNFLYYVLMHAQRRSSQAIMNKLANGATTSIEDETVKAIFEDEKKNFAIWIVFTLNKTERLSTQHNQFELNVLAHRRGLSKDGREDLAKQGFMLRRTTYYKMLKEKLGEVDET